MSTKDDQIATQAETITRLNRECSIVTAQRDMHKALRENDKLRRQIANLRQVIEAQRKRLLVLGVFK